MLCFGKDKDAIATERRASKILNYCIDEILYSNIVFEEKGYIGIDFVPFEKYLKTDGWCEVTERRCNPYDCEYYFDKGGCGYGADKPYRARLVYDSCFDHNYCLSIYYDLVHDYFNIEYDIESKSWNKIVNKN